MLNNNKDINEEIIGEFEYNFYGVIHKINGCEIDARIYDYKNHEIVDDITFDICEFPLDEQINIIENVVFSWNIGNKDGKPYSIFKLIKREGLIEEEKIKKEKNIQDNIKFFDKLS